jgi:hypothetical protein
LFSEKSFSLSRFEALCELAQTGFTELLTLANNAVLKVQTLTVAQERNIVENPKLLLVGVCIINGFSFADIMHKYQFTEPELIGLFVQLDTLQIIELLPENRYHLKISSDFHWQHNGPIQRFLLNPYSVSF